MMDHRIIAQLCVMHGPKDDRIRVIHKKNGGLSSARNAGMAKMTGKYVCFIDSDDWVETNTFEVLLELLKVSASANRSLQCAN